MNESQPAFAIVGFAAALLLCRLSHASGGFVFLGFPFGLGPGNGDGDGDGNGDGNGDGSGDGDGSGNTQGNGDSGSGNSTGDGSSNTGGSGDSEIDSNMPQPDIMEPNTIGQPEPNPPSETPADIAGNSDGGSGTVIDVDIISGGEQESPETSEPPSDGQDCYDAEGNPRFCAAGEAPGTRTPADDSSSGSQGGDQDNEDEERNNAIAIIFKGVQDAIFDGRLPIPEVIREIINRVRNIIRIGNEGELFSAVESRLIEAGIFPRINFGTVFLPDIGGISTTAPGSNWVRFVGPYLWQLPSEFSGHVTFETNIPLISSIRLGFDLVGTTETVFATSGHFDRLERRIEELEEEQRFYRGLASDVISEAVGEYVRLEPLYPVVVTDEVQYLKDARNLYRNIVKTVTSPGGFTLRDVARKVREYAGSDENFWSTANSIGLSDLFRNSLSISGGNPPVSELML